MQWVAPVALECFPEGAHRRSQVSDLLEVRLGELVEPLRAKRGQRNAHHALAFRIRVAPHEPIGDRRQCRGAFAPSRACRKSNITTRTKRAARITQMTAQMASSTREMVSKPS